jgi:hypothetical protein
MCVYICIYVCIYICMHTYIYIYICTCRERKRKRQRASEAHTSSTATSRKILALPTGPQPVRACGDAPNASRGPEIRVHTSESHVRCVVSSFCCKREREAHTNVCTHVYIYICICRERASERGAAVICKVLRVQREREMRCKCLKYVRERVSERKGVLICKCLGCRVVICTVLGVQSERNLYCKCLKYVRERERASERGTHQCSYTCIYIASACDTAPNESRAHTGSSRVMWAGPGQVVIRQVGQVGWHAVCCCVLLCAAV